MMPDSCVFSMPNAPSALDCFQLFSTDSAWERPPHGWIMRTADLCARAGARVLCCCQCCGDSCRTLGRGQYEMLAMDTVSHAHPEVIVLDVD